MAFPTAEVYANDLILDSDPHARRPRSHLASENCVILASVVLSQYTMSKTTDRQTDDAGYTYYDNSRTWQRNCNVRGRLPNF